MKLRILAATSALLVVCSLGCASESATPSPENTATTAAKPQITFGNGARNAIVTDGLTRKGATFTFREVTIDGPGWLVLHPFQDGKPFGGIYVGASYLADGVNRDVAVSVDEEPLAGTMFLVMLHSDVNDDRTFDFVFVDEVNVLDKAVFEGARMIAHPIAAP